MSSGGAAVAAEDGDGGIAAPPSLGVSVGGDDDAGFASGCWTVEGWFSGGLCPDGFGTGDGAAGVLDSTFGAGVGVSLGGCTSLTGTSGVGAALGAVSTSVFLGCCAAGTAGCCAAFDSAAGVDVVSVPEAAGCFAGAGGGG